MLNLHKNCKIVQGFLCIPYLASLLINILPNDTFVTINETIILIIKVHILFRFLQFSPNVAFLFQEPIQNTLEILSPDGALVNSLLWFFCFPYFGDLDSFEGTGQVFCRMSLNWNLSVVFLMIRVGDIYGFLGGKNIEMQCHSYHIPDQVAIYYQCPSQC